VFLCDGKQVGGEVVETRTLEFESLSQAHDVVAILSRLLIFGIFGF